MPSDSTAAAGSWCAFASSAFTTTATSRPQISQLPGPQISQLLPLAALRYRSCQALTRHPAASHLPAIRGHHAAASHPPALRWHHAAVNHPPALRWHHAAASSHPPALGWHCSRCQHSVRPASEGTAGSVASQCALTWHRLLLPAISPPSYGTAADAGRRCSQDGGGE